MYQRQTILHRQVHCLWCGAELEHKATGRGREFCSAKCRVYYRRAMKRHAKECVDAALARRPEPARDYGHPVEIRSFVVREDGTVTKWVRPQGVTKRV